MSVVDPCEELRREWLRLVEVVKQDRAEEDSAFHADPDDVASRQRVEGQLHAAYERYRACLEPEKDTGQMSAMPMDVNESATFDPLAASPSAPEMHVNESATFDPPADAPSAPEMHVNESATFNSPSVAPGEQSSSTMRISPRVVGGVLAGLCVVAAAIAIPLSLSGGGHGTSGETSSVPSTTSTVAASAGALPPSSVPGVLPFINVGGSITAGLNIETFTVVNPPTSGPTTVVIDFAGPGWPGVKTVVIPPGGSSSPERLPYSCPSTHQTIVRSIDGQALTASRQKAMTTTNSC